ncbi:predicted protein [Lichtheimia corymbifera JMRC:FSU:9682]|uniref:Uncharacterized protein n=1 Tax=Lichtheimia corymbifera JMRC:FSU:9682 TaxID=1263082 RepID=A0A068SA84_9FUNG|nr:predicted protein [Lichtheimia corymbifera JMRC:FSU:9682]
MYAINSDDGSSCDEAFWVEARCQQVRSILPRRGSAEDDDGLDGVGDTPYIFTESTAMMAFEYSSQFTQQLFSSNQEYNDTTIPVVSMFIILLL